jgi:beta-lactam-binding protein with PASTA domain
MTPPRTRITVEGGTWPAEAFARFAMTALEGTPANDFTVEAADVTGHAVQAAQKDLTRAGFDVTLRPRYSDRLPPGIVIEQEPAAGEDVTLPVGARALLTVSSNTTASVVVPDLLGRHVDDARRVLQDAGLRPRVGRACPGGTPTCTGAVERAAHVWEQAPEAGTSTTTGEAVSVRVFPSPR